MEKERTCFEVYDWMKQHQVGKNYSNDFIESYKDCYFLNRLSGNVFHGTYSGHVVQPDNDDKKYFVEDGIRGTSTGYFVVIDGMLIEVDPLNTQLNYNKYKEFTKTLSDYVYNRMKAVSSLKNIETLSTETKTQLDDHINSLETIFQLLYNY